MVQGNDGQPLERRTVSVNIPLRYKASLFGNIHRLVKSLLQLALLKEIFYISPIHTLCNSVCCWGSLTQHDTMKCGRYDSAHIHKDPGLKKEGGVGLILNLAA